ncbi:uncharacterized protein [Anabrus simplex]|uniref:uncharacterized protein isoform X2 n=1 Tax=Anabrus simplex TaxID=316456 RepID=UPI0035A2BD29
MRAALFTRVDLLNKAGSILSLIEDLVELSVGKGDKDEYEEVDPEVREIIRRAELAISIVMILALLTELIFSVLLVYGAVKEKPRFVKTWIYYSIVCLIVVDISLVFLIMLCFVFEEIADGIYMIVATIISTLIGAYFIVVVNSYHRQLKGIGLSVMPAKV